MTIHEFTRPGSGMDSDKKGDDAVAAGLSVVPLTNIAGRLRQLAEKIEMGDLKPDIALVVFRYQRPDGMIGPTNSLSTFCYGNYVSMHECDGIMLNAAMGKGIGEMGAG